MTGMIRARYELEAQAPDHAAEVVAGELSSGTFTAVPGESTTLRARHAAAVSSVVSIGEGSNGAEIARFDCDIPGDNIGASLPELVATLAGNVFELAAVEALRLIDFNLPDELAGEFPGPAFGVAGSRDTVDVQARPLIGTIIKPSVGLSPAATAKLAAELAAAGLDLIKDDELIANPTYSPLVERVTAVCGALSRVEQECGKRVAYVPNLSGEIDHTLRGAEIAAEAGAGAAMVCVHSVGLAGVLALRAHSSLPIHGHRAGWGLLGRGRTSLGPAAHARIWRLAGVDQLHVGGLRSKFFEPDASVAAAIGVCREKSDFHQPVLPVVSSGQWGGQLPDTVAAAGGPDFAYLAGGAILGHPAGPAAGVRALRAAADAVCAGVDLTEAAKTAPELATTIETFGRN